MGWYTNYEAEFYDFIDWDDMDVKQSLQSFNVQCLYLRDMELPRILVCVYSQNTIEEILDALKRLYSTKIHYRLYNSNEEWSTGKCQS